jgi:uncharacterized membrane protein
MDAPTVNVSGNLVKALMHLLLDAAPRASDAGLMPTLLALGELWVILIVAVPIVLIGMAIYSVAKLRKEENWEER